MTLLLYYKLEAFRADHHGFLQPSDRLGIHQSDRIEYLHQLVSNLPHTSHATALQVPNIETSLAGERCVRFVDSTVLKFTLEQEITPFGRIRPHSKAQTISKTGKPAPAPGAKKTATVPPAAKKTASPIPKQPSNTSTAQPATAGSHNSENRVQPSSFAAAASTPPPVMPPMNFMHPGYQFHPAFVDVATSTIATLERSIAQLYSELEAARLSISNLKQTIDKERADFAAYKASVESSHISGSPVDSSSSSSKSQVENVKINQKKSVQTQLEAQQKPQKSREKQVNKSHQQQRNADATRSQQVRRSEKQEKHQSPAKKAFAAKKTQTPDKVFVPRPKAAASPSVAVVEPENHPASN